MCVYVCLNTKTIGFLVCNWTTPVCLEWIRITLIVVYMYLVRDTQSHTWTGHLINRKSHLRLGEEKSNIWNEACVTLRRVAARRCYYPNATTLVITRSLSAPLCVLVPHSWRHSDHPNCLRAAGPHSWYALYVKLCHRLEVSRSHESAVPRLPPLLKNDQRKVPSRLGNDEVSCFYHLIS